ncbi:hypothetical protein SAMN03159443_05780 [Pseudomonas sp. NFACC15-1]|uniref:hypothetical protein n=1 Tax=unclassified Pseudomonas TaxID=196821 RepID=UPI0008822AAE|nr:MULTISPECIES: hypothetical protein [unclassified Pseudomonas]SDA96816.1 hypothetical protein SAMN03159443_05780 [Pseudomonas sp. NFACC15-1]SDX09959.1 hypothetical protein SAMN03159380_01708 [Pseudomonas sp. NFACC14]
MQSLENTLLSYATQHLPSLPNIYTWKFDTALVHHSFKWEIDGSNWYEKARALKRHVAQEWTASPEQRMALADYAVRVWGGVRGNALATMQGYVQTVSQGRVPDKHKGIASWSKVAAFSNPTEHAIFDARVAFSLNVLQRLHGDEQRWWFPHLAGRNTHLNACWPRLKTQAREQRWIRIATTDVYPTYIELLVNVSRKLDVEIGDVEMLLFSKAEDFAGAFNEAYPPS